MHNDQFGNQSAKASKRTREWSGSGAIDTLGRQLAALQVHTASSAPISRVEPRALMG
jgi:hypothetical protein